MENFINSFNYKPFMWDFIALAIALLIAFCVISILFESTYCVFNSKKEIDIKTEKVKKYRIIIPIIIILLIFTIQKYVESKQIHHLNDIKDNYNITINNNIISFDVKNSNIVINNKQTFIVTKENDNYKLENIEKPYETYNLTKSEFLDIFKSKYQPTNSVDIKNELNH